METTLGTQNQNPVPAPLSGSASHSRRRRRRLGEIYVGHRDLKSKSFRLFQQSAFLAGSQKSFENAFVALHQINKLDRVKALRFTAFGRQARIEQSLAALHQASTFHLTAEDWHWLDENSGLEDEFE
jgi:hypothetical protein